MASRFLRLELWSGLACAGGLFAAILDAVNISINYDVDGSDHITFSIAPGAVPASSLVIGKTVRVCREATADDEEFIVTSRTLAFNTSENLIAVVAKAAIPQILGSHGDVATYTAGGIPQFRITHTQQTSAAILATMLDHLDDEFGIDWITIGDNDADGVYDYEANEATHLDYLLGFIGLPAVAMEWGWERDGETGYTLHIVARLNSAAPVPVVESAYNLRSHTAQADANDMVNAITPRGIAVDGASRGIEEMTAKIASITGSDPNKILTFEESCVPRDDSLNTKWLVADNATFDSEEITDSTQPNQVKLASSTGFAAGDVCMFRDGSGANGREVTTLKAPASIAAYGHLGKKLHSDVVALRSWLKYGALPDWSAGDSADPDGWTSAVAGGTVVKSRITDPVYCIDSPDTLKLTPGTTSTEMGTLSPVFHVHGRTGKSRIAAVMRAFVESPPIPSTLTMYLCTGATASFDAPVAPQGSQSWSTSLASPTQGWKRFVILFDLSASTTASFRLALRWSGTLQGGNGDAIYLDSAMVVLSETADIPFIAGNGANVLRDLAIARLLLASDPVQQHEATLLDLGAEFESDRITKGGDLRIINRDFASDDTVRVMAIKEIPHDIGQTSLTLANQWQTMTHQVAGA